MPGGDEIRDVQRAAWAGLSAGWEKWDGVIMDQLGPVGTAMIERLGISGDQQHLDIAAGTGEPGLTVARLAPGGHVVLTDLAAEMLDIAARRADVQGITNFETRVCSADDLPFGDVGIHSISVRFGYMFFPDVAKATAEFARVLRPGGRAACRSGPGPGGEPVGIGDRHAGDRGGGGAAAARPGRAGYVPVRCPGICQCPVRSRGAARRCRVGRRRRTRNGLARGLSCGPASTSRSRLRRLRRPASWRGGGSRKPSSPGPAPRTRRQGRGFRRGQLHRRNEEGRPN